MYNQKKIIVIQFEPVSRIYIYIYLTNKLGFVFVYLFICFFRISTRDIVLKVTFWMMTPIRLISSITHSLGYWQLNANDHTLTSRSHKHNRTRSPRGPLLCPSGERALTLWLPSQTYSPRTRHLPAAPGAGPDPPEAGIQDSTGTSQGPTWTDLPTVPVSRTSESLPHTNVIAIGGGGQKAWLLIRWLFSHSVPVGLSRRICQILNTFASTQLT